MLTHSHLDHSEGADALGAPVTLPGEGEEVGPFTALATPGHSADSVCLVAGRVCFTGDTVLGPGSVFISPGEGSLAAYLRSLRAAAGAGSRGALPGARPLRLGPARPSSTEYIEHRLDRERRLLEALAAGRRSTGELLDAAWADAPAHLRPAAAMSLAAHLEKLARRGPPARGRGGSARQAAAGSDSSRCTATPAITSATPVTSTQLGTWVSTTTPITVAVAGSSATISA